MKENILIRLKMPFMLLFFETGQASGYSLVLIFLRSILLEVYHFSTPRTPEIMLPRLFSMEPFRLVRL